MPIIDGIAQQTPEWLQIRAGCCTASRVVDVVTRLKRNTKEGQKGDYAKARRDYLMELVAERLTGRVEDHYVTRWMEDGIENEPLAKAAYEIAYDVELKEGGFALHSTIPFFGASADSLVGNDGVLEIKCLKTTNHLAVMEGGVIPVEYMPQILAQLSCTEREWCDFVAFDPRLPRKLQLFVRRYYRDEAMIALMEAEVSKFVDEVIATIKMLEAA